MPRKKAEKPKEHPKPDWYREIHATEADTEAVFRALKFDDALPGGKRKKWPIPLRTLNKKSPEERAQIIWHWAEQRVAQPGGFFWFSVHIMGFTYLLPEVHGAFLCDKLEKILNTPARIFDEWHRGSFKTTVVSLAWPCWIMGTHPEQEIMIVQATLAKAKKTMGAIIRQIEKNRKLKTLFPKLRPATGTYSKKAVKWASDGIMTQAADEYSAGEGFSRDYTCGIGAVDGSSAGDHPTVLIVDDMEDERNTKYVTDIEKTKEVFEQYVGPVLLNECPCVVIGTPWAVNDLHHELRAGLRGKWDYFQVPLFVPDENGNPYYPVNNERIVKRLKEMGKRAVGGKPGFDAEVEAQKRRDMTPFQFEAQYMCNPTMSKHQKFDPDTWLTYETEGEQAPWYTPGENPKDSHAKWVDEHMIFVCTDVAQETGRTHDFTAFSVWGMDQKGHAWMHDVFYDKVPPHKQREAIFDLVYVPEDERPVSYWLDRPTHSEDELNLTAEQLAIRKLWQPKWIIGEDITYGKALLHELRQESEKLGRYDLMKKIRKFKVTQGAQKSDRILKANEPLFRAGRIHVPRILVKFLHFEGRRMDVMKIIRQEFDHFLTPGAHDDWLDGLHMARPLFSKTFRPVAEVTTNPYAKPAKKDMSLGLEWKEPRPEHRLAPNFVPEPYAVPRSRRKGGSGIRVARSPQEVLWKGR